MFKLNWRRTTARNLYFCTKWWRGLFRLSIQNNTTDKNLYFCTKWLRSLFWLLILVFQN